MNILYSFSANQLIRTEYFSLNCDSYMNTRAFRERMGVEPDQITRIIIAAVLDTLRKKRWNLIKRERKRSSESSSISRTLRITTNTERLFTLKIPGAPKHTCKRTLDRVYDGNDILVQTGSCVLGGTVLVLVFFLEKLFCYLGIRIILYSVVIGDWD